MKTSVVIRTQNEAPRLRLTLASLERQVGLDEVVVVDDGSIDDTAEVMTEADLPLVPVHHDVARGRAAASNAGAGAASSDLLIFLDGDTLAGPGMVEAHATAHAGGGNLIGRGETWHLRCTRFLSDPEAATLWPQEAERDERLSPDEREAIRVTRTQVRDDFDAIASRAAPGVYPGAAPRRLHEIEMDALRDGGGAQLWAAASGSNLSLRRAAFLNVGGFDPDIDINEHRELAYRLCETGARMVAVEDARTYHLTHRQGWRDPLLEQEWETAFRRTHPDAPIDELKDFWRLVSSGAEVALPFL